MNEMLSRATMPLIAFLLLAPGLPRGVSAQTRLPDQEFRILRPGQLLGTQGALGVEIRDVRPADVKAAKLPDESGAYVTSVTRDGAAAKAGIEPGDVVVGFDGEAVRSAAALARLIGETPADRSIKVTVVREGKRMDFTATLGERTGGTPFSLAVPRVTPLVPDRRALPQLPRTPRDRQNPEFAPRLAPPLWRFEGQGRLGAGIQDLTPQLRQYFGVQQGVLVSSVTPDSAAAHAGLKAGDVITAIGGQAVRTQSDVWRILSDAKVGDVVSLAVTRDRKTMKLEVTLGAPNVRIRPIEGGNARQGR